MESAKVSEGLQRFRGTFLIDPLLFLVQVTVILRPNGSRLYSRFTDHNREFVRGERHLNRRSIAKPRHVSAKSDTQILSKWWMSWYPQNGGMFQGNLRGWAAGNPNSGRADPWAQFRAKGIRSYPVLVMPGSDLDAGIHMVVSATLAVAMVSFLVRRLGNFHSG